MSSFISFIIFLFLIVVLLFIFISFFNSCFHIRNGFSLYDFFNCENENLIHIREISKMRIYQVKDKKEIERIYMIPIDESTKAFYANDNYVIIVYNCFKSKNVSIHIFEKFSTNLLNQLNFTESLMNNYYYRKFQKKINKAVSFRVKEFYLKENRYDAIEQIYSNLSIELKNKIKNRVDLYRNNKSKNFIDEFKDEVSLEVLENLLSSKGF